MSQKYLIIVGGPTASGKTALSIELAKFFDAPILSADSRQFYKEMRIGNARPSEQELSEAKHFFIADRGVEDVLSAGAFAKEALSFLNAHYEKQDFAIVAGGSGLFIKALTEGLDVFPEVNPEVRDQVDELYEKKGLVGLQEALLIADPAYYSEVDKENPSRLRRALEVCYSSGQPFSFYRQQKHQDRVFKPIYLQLTWPREQLYERINRRVDIMLEEGLEEEAHALYEYKDLPALKTVGYQEWIDYFDGNYDKNRAVELIKQNSRRYAKRQLTWFRRDSYWKRIYKGDLRTALSYIQAVQKDGVELLSGKEYLKEIDIASHYQVIPVAFGEKAHVVVWKNKDTAWLRVIEFDNSNHLGKSLLIHESLHRSACAEVYAFGFNSDLQNAGFEEITRDELPRWLKVKANDENIFSKWVLSKQVF